MKDEQIRKGYEYAKERYAEVGVDVDEAMKKADAVPVSMHCWQGDDVIGYDGDDALSGGIATTGNYPGRAKTPDQLRQDISFAMDLIPGETKLNLHASYAEKNGKKIDRDAYTIDEFRGWVDFAKEKGIGLDFNPTYFAHPMMDGNFSLSSQKEDVRKFWVEHGKRCREIGLEFAKELGKPCAINFWMPDGYKDIPADTVMRRDLMSQSLDEIFAEDIDPNLVPCSVESKLFGIGAESYTVVSHEYAYGYAVKNQMLYTLDAGHFHPTEVISAKLTACLHFLPAILLHVSRPVRWDSDHVIIWDDEIQKIFDEIITNGYENRTYIGLDYFDASINRIAAWAIGMRNARKAILSSYMMPPSIRSAEHEENYTTRLAMQEERRSLPFAGIWDKYCADHNVPTGEEWLAKTFDYERDVLLKR